MPRIKQRMAGWHITERLQLRQMCAGQGKSGKRGAAGTHRLEMAAAAVVAANAAVGPNAQAPEGHARRRRVPRRGQATLEHVCLQEQTPSGA